MLEAITISRKASALHYRQADRPASGRIVREWYKRWQSNSNLAVGQALQDGKLKREPCAVCGKLSTVAHHDSYWPDKWLDVIWLCYWCHQRRHQESKPECVPFPQEEVYGFERDYQ
jgi:hypothetical protein